MRVIAVLQLYPVLPAKRERNRIRGQLNQLYTDLKSLNDISDEEQEEDG